MTKLRDKGPWFVDGDDIQSDDFTHDVRLIVTGDFTLDDREAYLEWLCEVLNDACGQSRFVVTEAGRKAVGGGS